MIALRGVRSSWLMLARKPLFAALARSACSFASCTSSTAMRNFSDMSLKAAASCPNSSFDGTVMR